MSPTIGAVGRILVHEALAVLATDLRDLLLRHLTLWRHPVSRHGLTISRTPVGWVGIVSRIVSGRAITLWHRITWGHVALHRLWHATRWSKCNLCLARQIRPAFDLTTALRLFSTDAPPLVARQGGIPTLKGKV